MFWRMNDVPRNHGTATPNANNPSKHVRTIQSDGRSPIVLVVDDESSIRRLFRSTLEAAGFKVQEASNGKEAMAVVRGQDVDMVVMDLVMPEQEGIESIQLLRAEFPDLPILAVSGAFDGQFLPVAKLLGAKSTMTKPIDPRALIGTVRSLLGY